MEGPSLLIASESLAIFRGKTVRVVSGNTKIGKERLLGKKVEDLFSWGKHLVFQFDEFAIRIHFLLYGSFTAEANGNSITGDYKPKSREPRLALNFTDGNIKMYNCSIKVFDTNNLKKDYDFTASIVSSEWSSSDALEKVLKFPEEEIADVLLDQEIFAGVGNIIKNESLFLSKTHPETLAKNLSYDKLKEIIENTHKFSWNFYKWRKKFELKKHYQVYTKSICPMCGGKIIRKMTGKRNRRSFFCLTCQPVL